ncbi:hypothetical protein N658DRAFT_256197 [Parathielavia hyrcaniae]|uniref:Uncharacterized protein n=1 Tax=Parathielavia hyrcaniae TaxID=113614 RepID=A0AAN6PU00_9PEZI|nr:hypothetical protein N658DRAFT_256197 [Parathielavia hyrcaniae]
MKDEMRKGSWLDPWAWSGDPTACWRLSHGPSSLVKRRVAMRWELHSPWARQSQKCGGIGTAGKRLHRGWRAKSEEHPSGGARARGVVRLEGSVVGGVCCNRRGSRVCGPRPPGSLDGRSMEELGFEPAILVQLPQTLTRRLSTVLLRSYGVLGTRYG